MINTCAPVKSHGCDWMLPLGIWMALILRASNLSLYVVLCMDLKSLEVPLFGAE